MNNRKTRSQVTCAFRNGRLVFKDFKAVPEEYKIRYREIALSSIAYDADRFKLVPGELQNDRNFVIAAAESNGNIIYNAPEEFRKDPEVILAAIKDNAYIFMLASDELKNDDEFVYRAVSRNGYVLTLVDTNCDDKDLLLAAMSTYREAYDCASILLSSDPDILEALNSRTVEEIDREIEMDELAEEYDCGFPTHYTGNDENVYDYSFESDEEDTIPQDDFIWDADVIRPYLNEECGKDDDIYQEDEPDWDCGLYNDESDGEDFGDNNCG